MQKGLLISLLAIALLVGILADRTPDTSSELYPIASAINWVEGHGRALGPELMGSGINPVNTFRSGSSTLSRTPPAIMMHYGAVTRAYTDMVGRSLDGADLSKLSWWVNFLGVLPWALILFYALYSLSGFFGATSLSDRLTAAWATIFGSMAVGWFGLVSPYLPVAALVSLGIYFLLTGIKNKHPNMLLYAGLLIGISGAAHPSGWIWAVLGPVYLFITMTGDDSRQLPKYLGFILVGLVLTIALTLAGNFIFYGSYLPVQFLGGTVSEIRPMRMFAVAWHDIIGWNGVIWLAPLVIPGLIGIVKRTDKFKMDIPLVLLIGITAIILLSWGVSEDTRVIGELDNLNPSFAIVPLELNDGQFSIVNLDSGQGSDADRRAHYEMMFQRTDVFVFNGGRGVGIPIFLQASIFLSLIGWCRFIGTKVSGSLVWLLTRIGGFFAVIASQAPYGGVSAYYLYIGFIINQNGIPSYSQIPILEATLTVMVRLAELWPSGVVRF